MKEFDARSKSRLVGVHDDLVEVAQIALQLSTVPFIVTEGLRTLERQKELLAAGASKTLKSRHLTGHALDVAAYVDSNGNSTKDPSETVRWDWPLMFQIADAFRQAAEQLEIPVEWGGNWRLLNGNGSVVETDLAKFADGPHFQLPWRDYPV